MAWSDRDGDERLGRARTVAVALVVLTSVATLSGVAAPVGPVDVDFPLIGSGGDGDGGGGATAASLDNEGPDSDGDGLSDATETEIGADADARDTDGDGFPDGMEVGCSQRLPDADPLQQDVYVEVDSVEGVSLSDAAVQRLEDSFASAPVENPSGQEGIDLHLVRSDGGLAENGPVNNRQTPGEHTDVTDYRSDAFDNADTGYHYLLVVSDAAYNGDRSYAGAGHRGNAVVEHYQRDNVMASLIMHELGHSFGITHAQEGVDEEDYALSEYDSVMNYNGIYEVMTYSDGTDDVGRNEWAYVAEDRHKPSINCPDGNCTALCSTDA